MRRGASLEIETIKALREIFGYTEEEAKEKNRIIDQAAEDMLENQRNIDANRRNQKKVKPPKTLQEG